MTDSLSLTPPLYNDDIVRKSMVAALCWAVTSGWVWASSLRCKPRLPLISRNFEEYFSFGRLRPVHTTGVVFGFAGNILFATSFFVLQRTCRVRLWGDRLSVFVFWGYQMFVLMAKKSPVNACSRHQPEQGNMPNRNGMQTYGSLSSGSPTC